MSAARTITETRAYSKPDSQSATLWERAQHVLPGGNSRTTVFMAPRPIYAAEGEGCWIVDVDGDRRLDLLNNYTSLMHGHAHPAVTEPPRGGSRVALPSRCRRRRRSTSPLSSRSASPASPRCASRTPAAKR